MAKRMVELLLTNLSGGNGDTNPRDEGPYGHRDPMAWFFAPHDLDNKVPRAEQRRQGFMLKMTTRDWIAQGRPVRINIEVEDET